MIYINGNGGGGEQEMFVVKLSWLPYLLIIAGIYGVIEEPDSGFGLVCLVVGGIWAFILHKNKDK